MTMKHGATTLMQACLLLAITGAAAKAAGQVREAWAERYDGPAAGIGSADFATAVVVDDTGNVYVTGDSKRDGTFQDYTTLKYATGGTLLWERRFNGSGNGNDYGKALALDGAGHLYVTGFSWGAGSSWDYTTLKYDADGTLEWARHYMGPAAFAADDRAQALALDGDGNTYITGSSRGLDQETDYATVKYDADGNELWVRRYDGPGGSADDARGLAMDGDGNLYVTGRSVDFWFMGNEAPVYDFATIKYAPDGTELWVRRSQTPAERSDEAVAVALDADGNVVVTGKSTADFGFGISRYETVKYDPDGNLLWERTYLGPGGGPSAATALALDAAAGIYVTGLSWSGSGNPTDFDYATLKYDAAGNLLWEQRYDGPAHNEDFASALAVDRAGGVYVTGTSQRVAAGFPDFTEFYDYLTLKYTAAGNFVWEQRYNGPADSSEEGRAVVVDAAGNVHITGWSEDTMTGADYATVKYEQFPGDLDGDGLISVIDLLALLAAWGPCAAPPDPCSADLTGDGSVGVTDLLALLANWP